MDSQTDDLFLIENENDDECEDDDEDDLFSMAVKELSETNRQADEIARVTIHFLAHTTFSLIERSILATFHNIRTADCSYSA